jgi:uncharacterized membrane protein
MVMQKVLKPDELKQIEQRIKAFETTTRCELLMVMAESSDAYPGAAWRFGVMGGFLISLAFSYYFELQHSHYWPVLMLIMIFFMTWIGHFPWAKRLTLSQWEVDQQCMQRAVECFHSMGTTKVSHKVTAMIMISKLEQNIEVLVDEVLKQKISAADLQQLVGSMREHFRQRHMAQGLLASIQTLEEKIITAFSGPVSDVNPDELDNTIHFITD